jgi:hypothetical protein
MDVEDTHNSHYPKGRRRRDRVQTGCAADGVITCNERAHSFWLIRDEEEEEEKIHKSQEYRRRKKTIRRGKKRRWEIEMWEGTRTFSSSSSFVKDVDLSPFLSLSSSLFSVCVYSLNFYFIFWWKGGGGRGRAITRVTPECQS